MQVKNEITDYYDEMAGAYDSSRFGNSYGEFIDCQERTILAKSLRDTPRSQILDMACGTGRLLDFAGHGIDASQKMLEIARRKFPELSLYLESATSTHFNSDTFDAIISFHFLMHLDKTTATEVIDECVRILKNSGRLIVDFPSKYRRQLSRRTTEGWHCANDYTLDEFLAINENLVLKDYYGVMLFPVHRLSPRLRKMLIKLDTMLCHSFLRRYASYLVVVLEKCNTECN